jgi:hypothetical protein
MNPIASPSGRVSAITSISLTEYLAFHIPLAGEFHPLRPQPYSAVTHIRTQTWWLWGSIQVGLCLRLSDVRHKVACSWSSPLRRPRDGLCRA